MVGPSIGEAARAFRAGRFEEASEACEALLHTAPHEAEAIRILALSRFRMGQLEATCSVLARIEEDTVLETLHARGVSELQLGRVIEAKATFQKLTTHHPSVGLGHYHLGLVHDALGEPELAERAYWADLQADGKKAYSYNNLALLLVRQGRPGEAREVYQNGLTLRPSDANLVLGLAQLDLSDHRWSSSAKLFSEYLRAFPKHDEARMNYAQALLGLQRPEQAQFELHSMLGPSSTEIQKNPRLREVLSDTYFRLMSLGLPVVPSGHPASAQAKAGALKKRGEFTEAEQVLKEAHARCPQDAQLAVESLLSVPWIYQEPKEASKRQSRLRQSLLTLQDQLGKSIAPNDVLAALDERNNFHWSYQGELGLDLIRSYGHLHRALVEELSPQDTCSQYPPGGRRLRIGYLSSFFTQHSVSKLMRGFLEHMNRDRFEVFVYHVGASSDPTTESIRSKVEHFCHIYGNADQTATRVRQDRLDILVLTDIGMSSSSQALAARRMAPVQATTICHPTTSGYPDIDYYISIETWEPLNGTQCYTEQLVVLPSPGIYFDRLPVLPPKGRVEFGLPQERTLLISPQSLYKYLPEYDHVYARIIEAAPDADLVFIEGGPALSSHFRARMQAAFDKRNLSRERLHFVPRQSTEDYRRLVASCDVVLDSLPFSSFTSLLEIWSQAPTPLVARRGELMRERCAAATLDSLSLSECAASNEAEFEEAAIRLATDPGHRAEISSRLQANLPRLYSQLSPVRALEAHFESWVGPS